MLACPARERCCGNVTMVFLLIPLECVAAPADRASQYLLTVSKDNSVVLHSAESAFRPHEEMPASAVAVSSTQVAWLFDPIDRDMARSKDIAKRPAGMHNVFELF